MTMLVLIGAPLVNTRDIDQYQTELLQVANPEDGTIKIEAFD